MNKKKARTLKKIIGYDKDDNPTVRHHYRRAKKIYSSLSRVARGEYIELLRETYNKIKI